MPGCYLIAFPAFDSGAVPIQIVDLELDDLRLRVGSEYFIQEGGAVVVGKTNLSNFTLVFQLLKKCKFIVFLTYLIVPLVQPIKQVYIKIVHPTAFMLLGKIPLAILDRTHHPGWQLISNLESLPGMPLYKSFPESGFALTV